jgi:hypothetical protein
VYNPPKRRLLGKRIGPAAFFLSVKGKGTESPNPALPEDLKSPSYQDISQECLYV